MYRSVLILAVLGGLSCSREPAANPVPRLEAAHIEISVLTTGRLLVDGKETSLEELPHRLDELKARNGSVWYFREQSAQTPPKAAAEVLRMVGERQMPITLSSRQDFSDYVGDDGQLHSRAK